MKSTRISFFLLVGILLSKTLNAQENGSVGIGIENPNPNAILHLVSPDNNQGLLVPAITTTQRTSFSFTGNLTSKDNGLLVFDLTEKTFYFWQDTEWQALAASNQSLQFDHATNQLTLSGGNTINLSSLTTIDWNDLENTPADFLDGTDEVDDADADPTNEIQDLTISGTKLSITNNENATTIDLGTLAGYDNQDLIFSNGIISLSGDPNATTIDLSNYDDDFSDDFDGQFGSLAGVPEDLADGDQVDDADADPTNEIQTLAQQADLITLSDGGGTFSINDGDASDTNELITLTTLESGNVLRIVESGINHDVDLTSLVEDGDADPTNEIQSLTFNSVSNVLTLTKPGGSNDMWDLSKLDNATPWLEENSATNVNYTGRYAIANNMISRSNPGHVSDTDLMASVGALKSEMISSYGKVVIVPGDATNLRNIDPGIAGQELTLMVIGPGTLNVDGENGNLFLSELNHSLTTGSTLHLVYFKDQSSGTNFDGWMEISVSKSGRP